MISEDDIGATVSSSPSARRRRRLRWPEWVTAVATAVMVLMAGVNVWVAKSQWRAIEMTNEQALATARIQLRGYLLFESGRVEPVATDGPYRVILTVKNFGLTPAYNVRHRLDTRIHEVSRRDDFWKSLWKLAPPIGHVDEGRSADIGQLNPHELEAPELRSISDLNDIRAKKTKALYVRARLEYRDVFSRLQCSYILAVSLPDARPDRWKFRIYYHMFFEAENPDTATARCIDPQKF